MQKDSPEGRRSTENWIGVYTFSSGTINITELSAEDVQLLEMEESLNQLPITADEYDRLPEETREKISPSQNVALQPYEDFLDLYEKNKDNLNSEVRGLLPDKLATELNYENQATDEEFGREQLMNQATVLYAQNPNDLEQTSPSWDIINLRLKRANQQLEEMDENMARQEYALTRAAKHLENMVT